jgi:hypothetical protein
MMFIFLMLLWDLFGEMAEFTEQRMVVLRGFKPTDGET